MGLVRKARVKSGGRVVRVGFGAVRLLGRVLDFGLRGRARLIERLIEIMIPKVTPLADANMTRQYRSAISQCTRCGSIDMCEY